MKGGAKGARASDLRTRSEDELSEQVDNLGKEIFNLRFQRASGQLENTARVREVRRDIARLKTVAHSKRQGSAKSSSAKSSSAKSSSAKSGSAKPGSAKSRRAESNPAKSAAAKS